MGRIAGLSHVMMFPLLRDTSQNLRCVVLKMNWLLRRGDLATAHGICWNIFERLEQTDKAGGIERPFYDTRCLEVDKAVAIHCRP